MDWFAGPVSLGARQVSRRAPVQGGHRQHLRRRETVEIPATCSREQILEPVPVVLPDGDEVFRSQYKVKIT
jgi:hypothetical protein